MEKIYEVVYIKPESTNGKEFKTLAEAKAEFDYAKAWLNDSFNGRRTIDADTVLLTEEIYGDDGEMADAKILDRISRK